MKKWLIILGILIVALVGLSLESSSHHKEKNPPKTHEENWEDSISDLQETFDLSNEETGEIKKLVLSH